MKTAASLFWAFVLFGVLPYIMHALLDLVLG